MSPFHALRKTGRLKPGRVLDVGARDGFIARHFADNGCTVDALEPAAPEPDDLPAAITWHRTTLEDFPEGRAYDTVIASLVSHLVSFDTNQFLHNLAQRIDEKGVIYVTLIGDRDGWSTHPRVRTVSAEAAKCAISAAGLKSLYHADECHDGRLYSGEQKFWHLHHFVLAPA